MNVIGAEPGKRKVDTYSTFAWTFFSLGFHQPPKFLAVGLP